MKEYSIGDVFNLIRNGASIQQSKIPEGIPVTRIETIVDNQFDLTRLGYASIFNDEFSYYYLEEGDILMSHINSVSHLGKAAIFEKSDLPIIHGMNLLCLKANRDLLMPKYAWFYFKTNDFKTRIKKITKNSVNQASFNISGLKNIKIPLPPLPDQIRIAQILSQAESLIAQRKQSISLLDDLLKSTFLEMFGNPVKNEKGWEMVKFKEIAKLDRVQVTPDQIKNDDFYIGLEDIEKQTGEIIKTSTENADDLKSSKFIFTDFHILYAKLRPNLNKVALPKTVGICSTDIYPILPIENISNKYFICYLMRSNYFCHEMNNKATGANLPRASAGAIENFKTYQPPLELQTKFANIVEKVEALKSQYQQSLAELQNMYGVLSQKAFKGELKGNVELEMIHDKLGMAEDDANYKRKK